MVMKLTVRLKAPLTVELGDLHMFERFTERARQVVLLAQDTATKHRHGFIGTEHILHGLLREEEGLASNVLTEFGLVARDVESSIIIIVGVGEAPPETTERRAWSAVPFTPRARRTLELALREALSLGHNYIGTEHILLGLVRVSEGDDATIAGRILRDHRIELVALRNAVLAKLTGVRREAERREAERRVAVEPEPEAEDERDSEPEEGCDDDVGTKVRPLPTVQQRLARVEAFLGIPEWWVSGA